MATSNKKYLFKQQNRAVSSKIVAEVLAQVTEYRIDTHSKAIKFAHSTHDYLSKNESLGKTKVNFVVVVF